MLFWTNTSASWSFWCPLARPKCVMVIILHRRLASVGLQQSKKAGSQVRARGGPESKTNRDTKRSDRHKRQAKSADANTHTHTEKPYETFKKSQIRKPRLAEGRVKPKRPRRLPFKTLLKILRQPRFYLTFKLSRVIILGKQYLLICALCAMRF